MEKKNILKDLRTGEHPLGNHPAFPKANDKQNFEELLASDKFKDVVKRVKRYTGKDKITPQEIMEIMRLDKSITQIESTHKPELESLAVKLVKKYFNIKDEIDFDAKLVERIEMLSQSQKEPKEPKEECEECEDTAEIEMINTEVQKRRLINSMMQGAANKTHYIFHMAEDAITKIDPKLPNMYGLIMGLNEFAMWIIPDEFNPPAMSDEAEEEMRGGAERVDLSGPKPKIVAEARIFPILVHELVKGVMELISLHGLPKNKKHAQAVMDKADFLKSEIWDLRLGTGLWERFVAAIDGDSEDIKAHLWQEIIRMPAQEFNNFMKELFAGTKKGKQDLTNLANDIKKEIKQEESDAAINANNDNSETIEDNDDINIDDINISDLFN